MPAERIDEALFRKYLLGSLSEDREADVEDRAFGDQEFLRALEAAEADLIDAWVRGDLGPSEGRAFEQRFLASPQRRQKVEFARALAKVAADAKPVEPPRKTFWRWPFAMRWTPALQWAASLALLFCVAAATRFAIQNAAMRSRISALEARLDEQNVHRSTAAAPGVASLVLLPGLSRAGTRVPRVTLDREAQLVRIEVRLEPRDDYPRFRAELRTRRGDEVLTLANLPRGKTTRGYAVLIEAPAALLPTGQYELELRGIKGNSPEDVGFYYFDIDRR